jgi:hypothetical protein
VALFPLITLTPGGDRCFLGWKINRKEKENGKNFGDFLTDILNIACLFIVVGCVHCCGVVLADISRNSGVRASGRTGELIGEPRATGSGTDSRVAGS